MKPVRNRRVAGALAGIFVTVLAISGINLGWTAYEVNHVRAQFTQQARANARRGEIVLRKLCRTFSELHDLTPPAGNPVTNPSRGYLQGLHLRLGDVRGDIGCKGE